MNNSGKYLIWALLSVIGAFALGYIALNRGEQINALWIVVAAVCVYLIAYRFYGLYIAKTVLGVDPTRMTPAVRHNDGLDYVPTDKKVLFGHHFAAIAGAGPLVGPVLAAQMGYLPGMIWILAGVVLAGAVQDFMVLFVSTRRDGRSLGELVKEEMGATAGVIALVATFMIMVIILAVLAMIVVKALTHSPGGLRFCRRGAAGLAAAGPARLPLHLPQNRHYRRSGDRHSDYASDPDHAGADQIYRRYWPGMDWQPVPVPVYHYRLRRGVGLPRPDCLRYHAEDAGE